MEISPMTMCPSRQFHSYIIIILFSACSYGVARSDDYATTILSSGPAAYWRLGELNDTVASDQVGNNNGTYEGDPTLGVIPSATQDGDLAVGFPTNDSYMVVNPTTSAVDLPGPDGTGAVELWFNWQGHGNRREAMISNRPEHGFQGRGQDDSNYHYYMRDGEVFSYGGTGFGEDSFGYQAPIDEWTHLVFNTDNHANQTTLFVNGGLAAGGSEHTITRSFGAWEPGQLYIGRFPHSTPEIFTGSIDEVAIYKRSLTHEEIAAHFQAASLTGGGTSIDSIQWKTAGSGDWNTQTNWMPVIVPDANSFSIKGGNITAIFGDAIESKQTVYTDEDVTISGLQFVNSHRVVVAGSGSITLAAGTADPNARIDVVLGDHEFQAPVHLSSDTNTLIAGSLSFNNVLNLGGNTLNKTGGGTLNINNKLNTGGGSIQGTGGVIGGDGAIGGDLINSGATISPGTSSTTSSAIPEPSTLILLSLGMLWLSSPHLRGYDS